MRSNNFKKIDGISQIVKVNKVKDTLGKICSKFFKNKPKNIIAVTDTNGKSSVADFSSDINFKWTFGSYNWNFRNKNKSD